jgi:uncharacterized protein (DUF1697 family)
MRYFAFLRAINVGGRFVNKDKLREPFIAHGLSDVETFITSGNVIFRGTARAVAKLESELETRCAALFGFKSEVFIRTRAEIVSIQAFDAFPGQSVAKPADLFVSFVQGSLPADAIERLMKLRNTIDDYCVAGREVYWLRREPGSKFTGAVLERALKQPATMRNMNTLARLLELYPES